MTPRELAEAAVQQQTRLLADARARLDSATSARVTVDATLTTAEEENAKAVAASSAKREDDLLADAAGRSSVRLAHVQADQRKAVESHAKASADVNAAEGRFDGATRSLELELLLEDIDDPATDEELHALGAACADAMGILRDRLLQVRAILRRDAKRVQRARELGAPDVVARDGIAAAAGWLSRLGSMGAAIANGHEPHEHRYLFVPPAIVDADTDGAASVRSAAATGMGAITQGERLDRSGVTYGRDRLDTIAASWVGHRNYRSAKEALDDLERETAKTRAANQARAHDLRLGQLRDRQRNAAAESLREQADRAEAAREAQMVLDGVRTWSTGDGEVSLAPGQTPGRKPPPNPLLADQDEFKV